MTSCASCSSNATPQLLRRAATQAGGALLGLETSGPHGSLALFAPSWQAPAVRSWPARALPSEHLIPTLHETLAAHHLHPADLKALAVSHGPGSFTGIRVSMATASGMAQGRAVRLRTASSLATLARTCGAPRVLAVLQARQGRVFAGLYQNEPDGARALWADRRIDIARLWQALPADSTDCVCVGDAATEVAALAPHPVEVATAITPCACAVLVQASSSVQSAATVPFTPNYLEQSAAEKA